MTLFNEAAERQQMGIKPDTDKSRHAGDENDKTPDMWTFGILICSYYYFHWSEPVRIKFEVGTSFQPVNSLRLILSAFHT